MQGQVIKYMYNKQNMPFTQLTVPGTNFIKFTYTMIFKWENNLC